MSEALLSYYASAEKWVRENLPDFLDSFGSSFDSSDPASFFSLYVEVLVEDKVSQRADELWPQLVDVFNGFDPNYITDNKDTVYKEFRSKIPALKSLYKPIFDCAAVLREYHWMSFKKEFLENPGDLKLLPGMTKLWRNLAIKLGNLDFIPTNLWLDNLASRFGFTTAQELIEFIIRNSNSGNAKAVIAFMLISFSSRKT